MPRAKKVEADTVSELLLSDKEQAALNAERNLGILRENLQIIADKAPEAGPELEYSAEDLQKLDQFAIGLLRDGTGSIRADDVAFVNRVRDAYLRAEVMLTVRKEIAALEA